MSDTQDANPESQKLPTPSASTKKAAPNKAVKTKKAAPKKVVTKTPKKATTTVAKPFAVKPSLAKKSASKRGRGKRYTTEQKAEVLSFVDAHNAKNRRGGATAASRKFKVSQLTIGNWQREATLPTAKGKKGSSDISAVLKRLDAVHKKMAKQEDVLAELRKEYAQLRAQL